jgi:hypothetical protein
MSIIDTIKNQNPATNIPVDSSLADIFTNKGGAGTSFSIINLLIFVAGMAFFVNTLLAGWSYMFSSGDPKKTAAASNRLMNGLVGIIVVIASFLIVRVVSTIIGFQADPLI